MGEFHLHPDFEASSLPVGDLPLCCVRLQADARWPWLVLVPRWEGLVELEDLPAAERAALVEEVVRAGEAVRAIGLVLGAPVEKLNVGALGNVVSQLHVHVIGRRRDDPAGPAPVWGVGAAVRYTEDAHRRAAEAAALSLGSRR